MKKRILFLIVLVLLFAGCAKKKETPAEIMKKVDQNTETADYYEVSIDGKVSMDYDDTALTIPFDIAVKMDDCGDLSKMTMEIDWWLKFLGEEMQLKFYYQNGMFYIDDGTTRSAVEFDLQAFDLLESLAAEEVDYSNYDQTMTVVETDDGFVLESTAQADEVNELMKTLFSSEWMSALSTDFDVQIESAVSQWHISSDYRIISQDYQVGMKMENDGKLIDVNVVYSITEKNHAEPIVKLPDLSGWSYRKIACQVDTEETTMVVVLEAEGEEVSLFGVSYFFYYDAYGLTTKKQKEDLANYVKLMYAELQGVGINVVVQDDLEDHLVVSLSVDYPNASEEALTAVGVEGGLTYSELLGYTQGMECSNYE